MGQVGGRRHHAWLVRPTLGDDGPRDQIGDEAHRREDREDDGAHAHQRDVDAEAVGESGADAGDLAIVGLTDQPPRPWA